jgi:hypothetical protein
MAAENVQRFNSIVARVFELLYEEFPDPIHIGPDHFDFTAEQDWRDQGYTTVLSTVRWLSEEDYIRLDGYSNGLCLGVRLSQKGLTVLNATPDSLHSGETVGGKIKDALADGSKALLSKVIEQALDLGIKYASNKAGF